MRAVYMIKCRGNWVGSPALVAAGFPYASFRLKTQAQHYAENFVKQPCQIVRVHIKIMEPT